MKGINTNSRLNPISALEAKFFNFSHVRFPAIRLMRREVSSTGGGWAYASSLQEDVAFYEQLVRSYAEMGVRSVVVLNQQWYGDGLNTPWSGSVSWRSYLTDYRVAVRPLVEALRPYRPVYQVWNEPDAEVPHSSVKLDPDVWYEVHKEISAELRGHEVWLAGLCSGAQQQVDYFRRAVRNGLLRFDLFQTHLYGQWPNKNQQLQEASRRVSTAWFGYLADAINVIRKLAIPWGTSEMGVAEDHPFSSSQYADIARFYAESYEMYVRMGAKNVTFWAWSDTNRNGGMLDAQGRAKQPIYTTVKELGQINKVQKVAVTTSALNMRVNPSMNARIRSVVPRGASLVVTNSVPEGGVWLEVLYNGIKGYVHKDYVRYQG